MSLWAITLGKSKQSYFRVIFGLQPYWKWSVNLNNHFAKDVISCLGHFTGHLLLSSINWIASCFKWNFSVMWKIIGCVWRLYCWQFFCNFQVLKNLTVKKYVNAIFQIEIICSFFYCFSLNFPCLTNENIRHKFSIFLNQS